MKYGIKPGLTFDADAAPYGPLGTAGMAALRVLILLGRLALGQGELGFAIGSHHYVLLMK